VEVGSNCAVRNSQPLCNLAVFPPFQIMKEQHIPSDLRQPFQSVLQLLPNLQSPQVLRWPSPAWRNLWSQLLTPPKSLSPEEISCPIPDDGQEPPSELFLVPAVIQSLQCNEKGLLGHILCIFRIPRHGESHQVSRTHVARDQDPKSLGLTPEGRPDKLAVGSLSQCTYFDTEVGLLVEKPLKERHPPGELERVPHLSQTGTGKGEARSSRYLNYLRTAPREGLPRIHRRPGCLPPNLDGVWGPDRQFF